MNRSLLIGSLLMLALPAKADLTNDANQTLLPDEFSVYTNGSQVLNHPAPGFMEQLLPTVNLYKGNSGCYIACYSEKKGNAIYSVSENIYVLGQVRIAGRYVNRLCVPTNFSGKDIRSEAAFKTICNDKIATCEGSCWAGGDTGGWFGLE